MEATLSDTVLVMIVGPSAIGKSSLMNAAAAEDSEFSYVRGFTTREKRPNERTHYDFINRDEAVRLRDAGKTITYFEHPTTGQIYGTTSASFETSYCLLDVFSTSVQQYRELPFRRTVTISISTNPENWQKWFLQRFPKPSDEASKRLMEARQSIEWSLSDTQTHWLINSKNSLNENAKKLIRIARGEETDRTIPDEPRDLLKLIEKGIWS